MAIRHHSLSCEFIVAAMYRSVCILLLLISGCSTAKDKDTRQLERATESKVTETRTAKSVEDQPVAEAQDDSSLAPVIFLEIVSESSDRPFTESAFEGSSSHAELSGYLFEHATGDSNSLLFPALGTKPDEKHKDVNFWIGYRILDTGSSGPDFNSEFSFVDKRLVPVAETGIVLDGEHLSRENLRKQRAQFAAERPRVKLDIEKNDETARIRIGEKELVLNPGDEQVLDEFSNEDHESPAFHRLSARLDSEVVVADFDVLHQWTLSEKLLDTGPYEDALAATELVLLASPTNTQALRQWALLHELLSTDKVASLLEVQLKLPSGTETDELIESWKNGPIGFVYLSDPDAPAEVALTGTKPTAATLEIPTPSGRYRVTALLPGFQQFQQEIDINGRTKLAIQLVVER